jgi:hypothetical protein
MKKYYWINTLSRVRSIDLIYVHFKERFYYNCRKNEYAIVAKSRQLGISALSAYLWLMLFPRDKKKYSVCIATKLAKTWLPRLDSYDSLKWMQIETSEHNKLSLRLINGSQSKP